MPFVKQEISDRPYHPQGTAFFWRIIRVGPVSEECAYRVRCGLSVHWLIHYRESWELEEDQKLILPTYGEANPDCCWFRSTTIAIVLKLLVDRNQWEGNDHVSVIGLCRRLITDLLLYPLKALFNLACTKKNAAVNSFYYFKLKRRP